MLTLSGTTNAAVKGRASHRRMGQLKLSREVFYPAPMLEKDIKLFRTDLFLIWVILLLNYSSNLLLFEKQFKMEGVEECQILRREIKFL